MPIVDEHQGGVRRYAIFTFVTDDQGGVAGTPALRFPQSPHASSLEISTRLRHCESFFMKRMKSLEKGFVFPFVDVSFFSSYQNVEEMKRLLEPTDCVNLHDPAIHLQKGCYEEVQLVDPKRDMIQTPIDDDDEDDLGSGSGSADANRNDMPKPKIIHPPGIQSGADDYKKTRGYILIAYKTMEYMYSREFLGSWKTWTGVRYICMQMPRQLGLRRIAFYRQMSCTSDFSYVLLIEVTNLLLYAAQTLNLMNRIKLRLCGCAGVYRETDFQVDPVTANIHHIPTTYRPPEKAITTLGRLDSVDSGGSANAPSRKSSQAVLTDANTTVNGSTSTNVDMLMQLLKQQQEAAERRKATMEAPSKAKKRHSLAPPEYPPPSAPTNTTTSITTATPETSPPEKEKTSKKAPRAESEDSDEGDHSSPSLDTVPQKAPKMQPEKRLYPQPQLQQPSAYEISTHVQHHLLQPQQAKPQIQMHQQRPVYHNTSSLYPMEISTAVSTPIPQQHPYFAQYHQSDTLPMQRSPYTNMYGQILSHPIDAMMQNRQPLKEMIENDYHKFYTYSGKPVISSPFGYVQASDPHNTDEMYDNYNSPVYTRSEWKNASAIYAGQTEGEESIRNLAEQFRSLRETPIIGSDPYLAYTNEMEDTFHGYDPREEEEDEMYVHRKRSQSAAFVEDAHKRSDHPKIESRRSQHDRKSSSEKIQKIHAAEQLQQKILEAEKLQKKIMEAERLHMKLAEAEMLHQQQAAQKLVSDDPAASQPSRREKPSHRQKSAPKLDESPAVTAESPKRRQLPKLPDPTPVEDAVELRKRRHQKRDDTVQKSPPKKEVKEASDVSMPRHRNGLASDKSLDRAQKPQRTPQSPKDHPDGDGAAKSKPSPDTRSRRPENGSGKRQASSSGNGRTPKSPQATGASPAHSDHSDKTRPNTLIGSRSRSRDEANVKASKTSTSTQEAAAKGATQKPPTISTNDQPSTTPKDGTLTKSKPSPKTKK